MIHPKRLLDDLKRLLRRLEADLRERAGAVAELAELLQREYRAAREAGRTGESFEMWRDGTLTQAAAAWLLGCVFVPTFKGGWSTAVNFAPLPSPDTKPGRYP
jgi:hypothetical protein